MSGNLALKIDDLDNVATIFANGMKKGMSVEIHDKKGHSETITLLDDIPYGHKIALCDLAPGDLIMKIRRVYRNCQPPDQKRELCTRTQSRRTPRQRRSVRRSV